MNPYEPPKTEPAGGNSPRRPWTAAEVLWEVVGWILWLFGVAIIAAVVLSLGYVFAVAIKVHYF